MSLNEKNKYSFYAKVSFIKDGKRRTFLSLVSANFDKTEKYLKESLGKNRFSIDLANNLPLKRLSVHSGLAKYGCNNITYVNGLGSNFSYVAYFSEDFKSKVYMLGINQWYEAISRNLKTLLHFKIILETCLVNNNIPI